MAASLGDQSEHACADRRSQSVIQWSNLENEKPGSGESLVTKIADLGMMIRLPMEKAVERPSRGTITSIAYRSPEVYFNKPWTTATDILGKEIELNTKGSRGG
ncbi:hypothetical protein CIHG_04407 [Coccidioides immitis H538.4]|uniref:Protein kinase domain-containing protein n=3 Tax=Coccidioides immitis TaxID=5501 RepID=A0A0J8R8N7_COCIT|nr:hypothetical protein CIRG_09340 [Coccidioides immitis RMSCC 2394]KMU80088.1 hypothetical protein CISG_08430 [Coccidioides immitis RMSCC 3703]KMU86619.1 hypothetical protein CIHG_04407 [Coccidioides immitis H538.4]